MPIDRREFLKLGGLAAVAGGTPAWLRASTPSPASAPAGKADYTLRIARSLVELSPDHIVSTTTYNGQFPGPLIRLREGQRAVVDVYNDTDLPEQLHWHG